MKWKDRGIKLVVEQGRVDKIRAGVNVTRLKLKSKLSAGVKGLKTRVKQLKGHPPLTRDQAKQVKQHQDNLNMFDPYHGD